MRTPKPWAHTLMDMAYEVAKRSKDDTQVGAVIVDGAKNIVSTGYNGCARGVADRPERYERPAKRAWIVHAEANAVFSAARRGVSTNLATLYCTHHPCAACADALIQAGITCVVVGPGATRGDWAQDDAATKLAEAGVSVTHLSDYGH